MKPYRQSFETRNRKISPKVDATTECERSYQMKRRYPVILKFCTVPKTIKKTNVAEQFILELQLKIICFKWLIYRLFIQMNIKPMEKMPEEEIKKWSNARQSEVKSSDILFCLSKTQICSVYINMWWRKTAKPLFEKL